MIELGSYNRKSKMPEADYVLDKSEMFLSLLDVLTPKFKGNWKIVLVDPKIKDVKALIEQDLVPDYIDCLVLLQATKLETVVMDHPKLSPKTKSVKEIYKEMVSGLNHLIDKNAMWTLYNAIGANVNALSEALTKLDAECEGVSITVKQVQSTFAVSKRVFASDVLSAFLKRDRYRWQKLDTLVKELGDEIAYYAIYKQVRELLVNKDKYLHNEDVKGRLCQDVDAPLICYTYVLFANSRSWRNLYGVMHDLDSRCEESLERSQYVNLQ